MIAAAPVWAAWLALTLSGLAVATWVVVIVVARRAWARLRPLVEPYLVALGLAATEPAPRDPDPLDVQRAPWKQ